MAAYWAANPASALWLQAWPLVGQVDIRSLVAYECFDSTTSTKFVVLVKHSRLVVGIPQPDCLFSAVAACQQVPNQRTRDICLVAVFSHPSSCSAYLRVGGVVLQQDSWQQDWLDAFHAVSDVAPVRNHTCDSAGDSCDDDWICSVTICLIVRCEPDHHALVAIAASGGPGR
jgi:hypothetical protein